jgi:GntR family transcriptional regulator / MocR family aminotransferase
MLIPLNLQRDQPLQQQLYDQLRTLISSERLRAGLRMPPTRALAEQFNTSRNTVLLTYKRLIAEGYLETLPAKGAFVARFAVVRLAARQMPAGFADPPARFVGPEREPGRTPARVGRPDASLFPAGRRRTLIRAALDGLGAQLGADHPAGSPALRRAIADWLSSSRGLAVASSR